MKFPPIVHRLLVLGVMAWLAWARVVAEPASAASAADDIFRSTNLLRITITVPEAGAEMLRQSQPGAGNAKPKARAVVSEGGRTYRDVAVQLKGFTTFQPLDATPSLTLDFNQFVPGQKFHGLTRISLNNSLQDPSRLHEKMARELFAAAGVPVPRADHAWVTLNGRELGLYVLVEGYSKSFLQRHFPGPPGHLYEWGVLEDIHRPLPAGAKGGADGRSEVDRLLRAAREPDPSRRWAALTKLLDLDRFLAMVAVEAMLCHSDSYSMNRNNYRLYHDPTTDRFVFLPHGMDRILGTHRSNLDLPIVPPSIGIVTRAVLSTPEGRRRYVETAGTLFTNLFDPGKLCRRVREIDAKIGKERLQSTGNRSFWNFPIRGAGSDGADLCRRIEERAADLKLQFTQRTHLLEMPTVARFNPNGETTLADWRLRPVVGRPPMNLAVTNVAGRRLLHLQSSTEELQATLTCRLALPAGNYRLVGLMSTVSSNRVNAPITVLRYFASDRFTTDRRRISGDGPGFAIAVQRYAAPEEFEFLCDVRSPGREIWLDPSTLELVLDPTGMGIRKPRAAE